MHTWYVVHAQSLGSSVAALQYEIIANNGCVIREFIPSVTILAACLVAILHENVSEDSETNSSSKHSPLTLHLSNKNANQLLFDVN